MSQETGIEYEEPEKDNLQKVSQWLRDSLWAVIGKVLCENPEEETEKMRQEFKKGLFDTIDSIKYRRRRKKLGNIIGLLQPDENPEESGEERTKRYIKILRGVLEGKNGIKKFWELLETIIGNEKRVKINPETPMSTLERNCELLLAFINAAREHNENNPKGKIYKYIKAKVIRKNPRYETKERQQDFTGAAIPQTVPAVDEFIKKCENHPRKIRLFDALIASLPTHARPFISEDQILMITATGAKDTFMQFCGVYLDEANKQKKTIGVYTTNKEYLPMLGRLESEPEIATIHKIKFNKESREKFIEDLIAQLKASTEDKIVVFISANNRFGEKMMDPKLIARIKNEMKAAEKEVEIWVDAAQSNTPFKEADAAFYSKRVGTIGSTAIVLGPKYNQARKGEEEDKEDREDKEDKDSTLFTEPFAFRSTYPIKELASICASLYIQEQRIGNKLEDLITTPTLWNFTGEGKYIDIEAKRFKKELEKNRGKFGEHFGVAFECNEKEDQDTKTWRFAKIITLRKKPESPINLRNMQKELEDTGIMVDLFSISSRNHALKRIIKIEKARKPDNETPAKRKLEKLLQQLQSYQDSHQSQLAMSLIAPGLEDFTEEKFDKEQVGKDGQIEIPLQNQQGTTPQPTSAQDLYEKQLEYLEEVVNEHEFIRIFIDIKATPADMDNLVKTLKSLKILDTKTDSNKPIELGP